MHRNSRLQFLLQQAPQAPQAPAGSTVRRTLAWELPQSPHTRGRTLKSCSHLFRITLTKAQWVCFESGEYCCIIVLIIIISTIIINSLSTATEWVGAPQTAACIASVESCTCAVTDCHFAADCTSDFLFVSAPEDAVNLNVKSCPS